MYESFYGLKSNPFQLTPSANLFFTSRAHKQGFAYMQYGVKQGEGFIVITGEIGTGKTTLVERLFSVLEYGPVVAGRVVTTNLQGDEVPYMVAGAFDIDTEGLSKPQVLKRIETFLLDQSSKGKRVLLVIDEAQNLSLLGIEELRMLSNIVVDGKPVLQCFLLGQIELRQLLAHESMEQFRQRIIASCHLEPLSEVETRDYVLYRLIKSGWKNDPKFMQEALDRIFEHTQGIPRQVNQLCNRVMLLGALEELHHIGRAQVDAVIEELAQERDAVNGLQNKGDVTDDPRKRFGDDNSPSNTAGSQAQPAASEVAAKVDDELLSKMDNLEERLDQLERKMEYLHGVLVGRLGQPVGMDSESFQLKTFKPKPGA